MFSLVLPIGGVWAALPEGGQGGEAVIVASVPEEPANLLTRPDEMSIPLSLPEEPAILTLPADALTVPPMPGTPAISLPLTDPLTVLPLPEKPSDAGDALKTGAKTGQTGLHRGQEGAKGVPPPAGFRSASPLAGQPQRSWFNQQLYGRYCANCHGFLPPDRVDALLARDAQRSRSLFTPYPPVWGGGPHSHGRAGW
ncbi:MAG: hypothetical protein H7836_07735 [Magnetococcus sp. YQC-3]